MIARVHAWLHRPSWCLWCGLLGFLALYHTVGERLGLPHGAEYYIESWMMAVLPEVAHD